MTRWSPVIGIEVHVQLRTKTKMFSPCPYAFGEPQNTLADPYVVGLPGTLPVANREAFTLAIRTGLALEAEIAEETRFDRKNYFYPDLPKGYQISQLELPVTKNGRLLLPSGRAIRIRRAHLEEDAGKAIHAQGGDHSLVDLNRCGVPLLEIVSEPDIRSAEEAVQYLDRLKHLLRWLDVSDCDMEKGSLRCDVNVSLRRDGSDALGTRTEIKNLNSFKAVEKAIEHECARHERILEAGGAIEQATMLWDEDRGETRVMRTKEESADYRYFPDPDLPPHHVSRDWVDGVRAGMPELPWVREERFRALAGITPYDAALLVQDRAVADFFEEAAGASGDPKATANWITGDLFALMRERDHTMAGTGLSPRRFAALVALVGNGSVNAASGRKVLEAMYGTDRDPEELVDSLGLGQISDPDDLRPLVRKALDANPKAASDLRAGKKKAAGAILGQVMKETRGRANPRVVNALLDELLS